MMDVFTKKKKKNELRIWSHLLKKSLMGNFIFYAVKVVNFYKSNIGKYKTGKFFLTTRFLQNLFTWFIYWMALLETIIRSYEVSRLVV